MSSFHFNAPDLYCAVLVAKTGLFSLKTFFTAGMPFVVCNTLCDRRQRLNLIPNERIRNTLSDILCYFRSATYQDLMTPCE